jgi:hypothetical protein
LQAGLALARLFNEAYYRDGLPYRQLLRAVDVSLCSGRQPGPLRISTRYNGLYLIWGLPPGAEHGVEPSAQAKLDSLRDNLEKMLIERAAEAGAQVPPAGEIDLRWPGLLWRPAPTPVPPPGPALPRGRNGRTTR